MLLIIGPKWEKTGMNGFKPSLNVQSNQGLVLLLKLKYYKSVRWNWVKNNNFL